MAIIGDALRQAFMPNHEYQRLREESRAWGRLQRPLVTASAATVGFVVFVSVTVNLSIVFPREASQRPFCRDWKVLQALQLNMSQESELHQYHGAFYLTDQEVVDYYWTVVFIPSAIIFLVSVAYLVSGSGRLLLDGNLRIVGNYLLGLCCIPCLRNDSGLCWSKKSSIPQNS